MRIMRIAAPWLLLVFITCSLAWGQGPKLNVDVFAEGGVSFIENTKLQRACPALCTPSGCPPCPGPLTFSNAGRLFTGVRLRMGHAAIEASYSYSPNQAAAYNRLNVFSFNYVEYLWLKSKVQPFATFGLGASRLSGTSNTPVNPNFVWNYGGGADIRLHRHLALRLELRDYVGGLPGSETSHNIVPSAGIVFRFK